MLRFAACLALFVCLLDLRPSVWGSALANGGVRRPSSSSEAFRVYVGDLGPTHAILAWGRPGGRGNLIGREARSYGKAVVRIGEQTFETERSWVNAGGLQPDRRYEYEILIEGSSIAKGALRTWPAKSDRLTFFVLGDFGNGSTAQYRIAQAMAREFDRRVRAGDPVRFVLSTGDNVYAAARGVLRRSSGSEDADWWSKFFDPYAPLLRGVPFYPVLGNHDGNESESQEDLPAYLDNFFFPGGQPARYYSFQFGGLADFFALDSTAITESGPPRAAWLASGQQFAWAQEAFRRSQAAWKIVYLHHPIFNAGPRHQDERNEVRFRHFVDLFAESGVKAVFHGHEHNFQVSAVNQRSRGIRFIVTGAGGELRSGDIRSRMAEANIEAWAPQHHFLRVEIEGTQMRVTPLGYEPVLVRSTSGAAVPMPLRIGDLR